MIHTTTWKPDTCSCVIEYEWDDEVPLETREHTIKNIVKGCEHHDKNSLTQSSHFETVKDENQRKNLFLKEVMDTYPEVTEDQVNDDGSTVKVIKKGVKYDWSFDEERNLVADIKGASLSKNALRSMANSKFDGRVKMK